MFHRKKVRGHGPRRLFGTIVNWVAIGTIAEVIGAVAVVVSVINLAFQVRENTRLSAEQIVATAIDAFNDYDRLVESNRDRT